MVAFSGAVRRGGRARVPTEAASLLRWAAAASEIAAEPALPTEEHIGARAG